MPRVSPQAIQGIVRRLREIPRPSRTGSGSHRRHNPFEFGLFRITGHTQDGSNKRWSYSAKKLGRKSGAGYAGTWADDTVDTTTYTLYSLAEKINGSSGTYGNGVTQANLDAVNGGSGTHALQPLPNNDPVFAVSRYLDDGTLEWWIVNWPSGIDGGCASS